MRRMDKPDARMNRERMLTYYRQFDPIEKSTADILIYTKRVNMTSFMADVTNMKAAGSFPT